MIDVDRLGVLLDRGADAMNAAQQARKALSDAEESLKNHRGSEDARNALQASVERRKVTHTKLARSANLWLTYCDALRAVAKKQGVVL